MDNGVFASNINSTADDKTIRTFFNQFGSVAEFNLQPDKFNENAKICYLKYASNEGAAKAVKMADKSTEFGDALRVSFKKFVERNSNGVKTVAISRIQSFGRGRGVSVASPTCPSFIKEDVQLKFLDLTLERKFAVEIVELKNLTNVFARPLLLTDKARANLYGLLEKMNEEANKLVCVKNPEVNNFYLAKWTEDNKFYRSRVIEKLSDNKFEVCFVDEGTTGDIVTELRVMPEELSDIPCQFIQCTLDCSNSQDMIDLVLKEGSESTVFIYATSKADDKYVINIFINDKDVIDIYKSKSTKDPRHNKLPNKQDVILHSFDVEYHDCKLIRPPYKESNHVTVLLKERLEVDLSKLQPLKSSPIPNDFLVYKDSTEGYCRCVIESYKFVRSQLMYSVFLVDKNKSVETDKESLMTGDVKDLTEPFKVITGVIDCELIDSNLYDNPQTIKLSDYDAKKDLYVIEIVKKVKVVADELVGQTKTVLLSHIESVNEFYVQYLDSASLQSLAAIQDEINDVGYQIVRVTKAMDLRLNEIVVAPFQEMNYRATVLEVDAAKNKVLLYFMDFGNSEWIVATEVIKAHKSVASKKPLAVRCRLSVTVQEDKLKEVTTLLLDYCDQGESEVLMQIKDLKEGALIVNLTVKNKSTFEDILEFKRLIVAHNINIKELLIKKIAELEKRILQMEKTHSRK